MSTSTQTNRIAVLGGLVASLGFFFFPLIELRPNRLASGVPFQLLELEGDLRYLILFVLAILPIVIALRAELGSRGWLLVGVGNVLLFLTLFLPTVAGELILADAASYFGDNVRVSNPRMFPSAAIILGLVGAYMTITAGLKDLKKVGTGRAGSFIAASFGVFLVLLALVGGQFDSYSVMVEFAARGELLSQRFIEHIMFVSVALVIGFVLGVGMGLWASRDERISPIILYAVGIIQTVPSLALFGLLLTPLARLGDVSAADLSIFFGVSLLIAGVLAFVYLRLGETLQGTPQRAAILLTALSAAVPLVLLVVVLASFLFRVSLTVFTSSQDFYLTARSLILWIGFVSLALWALGGALKASTGRLKPTLRYAGMGGLSVAAVVLVVALVRSSSQFLVRVDSFATMTTRDLGVSGIGPAPAVIALTLYSLLPLVRNTFAGLNNVDKAIIDSGRGMGMTPAQRFFQIELPIAMPVIIAGVRNAAVALVGIGTIATVIGAGGLGDFIYGGIVNTSIDQILLGTIPSVLLAILLDALLRGIERLIVSPGIAHLQS